MQALRAVSFLPLRDSLIMVVAFEQLLNAGPLKLSLVLPHLLRIGILPLAVGILGIEVVLLRRWHEWRWHTLLSQGIPVKPLEPLVLLEDVRTFFAETVTGFALDEPVDDIGGLDGPPGRDLVRVNLDLL